MKKIINIGNKELTLKSSAYTVLAYKEETGKNLLEDLQKISDLKIDGSNEEQQRKLMVNLEPFMEMLLKLIYVMYKEANKDAESFKDFCEGIDSLFDNVEWLQGVLELAAAPFSGTAQGSR